MDTLDTLITLDDAETMYRRLCEEIDEPRAKQKLFPLLLKMAGEDYYISGVLTKIDLALADYAKGLCSFGIVHRSFHNKIMKALTPPEMHDEVHKAYLVLLKKTK